MLSDSYLVDGWVVDDFVGEPDALLGELLARFVGDLHGALDAPAEPVCLGELDGDQAPGVRFPVLPERLDHVTCSRPIRMVKAVRTRRQLRATYWCTPGS
jgi:hypothetical protein